MEPFAENKMGTLPVKSLLLQMSCPIMLSMLISALYNLVDSVFVAQISEDAFVALSLAFPVQTLMTAVCVGTGIGVNALLSRRLGERRLGEANAAAVHGYFVYGLTWLAFALFGGLFSHPFISMFTDNATVIRYGTQYLQIVTIVSVGACFQFATERILQATGNSVGPMIIQGTGAVFNLIFDPILIFGLFGFPRLEVMGAALATVLGQLVGMSLGLIMVARNKVLTVQVRGFRPNLAILRDIYRVGLPAIFMQALTTVMTIGMNKILALYSGTGVFILGAYFKIQSFIFMPVYGVNTGLIPVVSYNYGARNRDRVTGLIRFALQLSACIMAVGALILLLFPGALLTLFRANPAVLADGIPALRMVALSFLPAGVSIIFCSSFQAMGSSTLSLVVSLLRQAVILLPCALLLGFLNPGLMWLAFLCAELASCLVSLLLYRRLYRHQISKIGDESLCAG